MESIEKLRGWETSVLVEEGGVTTIGKICDEIEAEIERDYMKLPVDADGVPIHVGDVMTLKHGKTCEVVAVSETQFTGKKFGSDYCVCHASLHRHVKPRTLEDVLCDVWNEALDYANSDIWRDPSEVFAERADEIRELLGGDA